MTLVVQVKLDFCTMALDDSARREIRVRVVCYLNSFWAGYIFLHVLYMMN
jgi:hypothetical protein